MADGKLGLGATIWAAWVAPQRLFDAAKAGQVTLRPFMAYAVTSTLAGAGMGVQLALLAHQSPVALALAVGVATLVLSPLAWWIDVGLTHVLARWYGAKGALDETRVVVGLSSLPGVLGILPYAVWPASLWSMVVRVRGLRTLHQMKTSRAWMTVLGASFSLVVMPVLLAITLRLFVLEAFKVPAGSMFPSIEIGDHLFVAKSQYGFFSKSLPERGDVVVFEYPQPNPNVEAPDYIKRVIALPGEKLEVAHGRPSINGWAVPQCLLGRAHVTMPSFEGGEDAADYRIYLEFLEGKTYLVALQDGLDNGIQGPYLVKPNEYWVLGDNRDNSADSRAWYGGRGGGVPLENTRGRARWLWFPSERLGIDLAGTPVLPQSLAELAPQFQRCLEQAPAPAQTFPPPPVSAQ